MAEKGSIGGMKQAEEGSAIEEQWDESVGGKPAEGPSENAALPGRRNAVRVDARMGNNPPGGEGDGRRDKATPRPPRGR